MNQKISKRLRRFSEIRELQPNRQKRFYKNAKRKFKRSNIIGRTLLNSMLKRELGIK